MFVFDLINISLLAVVFIYLLFALLIIQKGKDLYAYFHLLIILSVIFWTAGMFFYRSATPENVVLYCTILYIGPTFIASVFFLFSFVFPHNKLPSIWCFLFTVLANLLIIALVLVPELVIVDVEIIPGEEHRIIWGKYYFVYVLYQVFFVSASLVILFRKYLKEKGRLKYQLRYVLVGCSLSYSLAMVTNLIVVWWGDFRFNWMGQIFSILMASSIFFAIIKYRLMGIRFIASKIYIYLIVAIFAYIYFQFMLYVHILVLSGKASLAQLTLFDLSSTIVFAITLLPFLLYIQKSSDILFFKGQNPRKLIKDVSIRLSGVIDLGQLAIALNEELRKVVGTEKVFLAIKDPHQAKNSDNLVLLSAKDKKVVFTKEKFPKEFKIFSFSKHITNVITKEELKHIPGVSKGLLSKMSKYDTEGIVPLEVHKKPVGVLLLSSKITQEEYSLEDIEFIEIIASQVAIAIENAKLYNKVKIFNRRLKIEIKSAIKDFENSNKDLTQANVKLVRAYEKLHKLDRAKSEFLSIASHQLRTPLTSIKGFTSLLLEGTYGEISQNVRTVLGKVFTSNERLIHLVEDLLNISRIESGRFVFDLKENKIQPLIEEIIDSFIVPAKAKKIKFEYKPSKQKIPPFIFDNNKIQELLSNLIDNAVKYTQKGVIKVSLKYQDNKVLIKIKDSGMGISKGETEYIFDKFQRGKGVTQVHTEGVGLGLYVCKKVIEAHKGRIWAESPGTGKGSTFFVELKTDFKPTLKAEKELKK